MRGICLSGVAAILVMGAAIAAEDGWREYSYPESGFAAQYPNRPNVVAQDYKTAQIPEGVVKERVYSYNSGGVIYAVAGRKVVVFGVGGAHGQEPPVVCCDHVFKFFFTGPAKRFLPQHSPDGIDAKQPPVHRTHGSMVTCNVAIIRI